MTKADKLFLDHFKIANVMIWLNIRLHGKDEAYSRTVSWLGDSEIPMGLRCAVMTAFGG